MKMIYVAHPFNGQDSNRKKMNEIISMLREKNKDICYISPLNAFGHLYKSMTYDEGMNLCFALLIRCDAIYLTGDWKSSKGCLLEYNYAKSNGIPIIVEGPEAV